MKQIMLALLAGCGLFGCSPEPAAESTLTVSIVPPDVIYPWEDIYDAEDGEREQIDVVLQGIVLQNLSTEETRLQSILVEVLKDGDVVASQALSQEVLEARAPFAEGTESAGLRELLNADFGLDRFLDASTTIVGGLDLGPNTALLIVNTRIWLPVLPDLVRVTAIHSGDLGDREATTTVPVRRYTTKNDYYFPLEGRWFMNALPAAVRNHHRYHPLTEFGVDLIKLGPGGAVWEGDYRDPRNFFGFAERVFAAADGEVVAVNDSGGSLAPRPKETPEEFQVRKQAAMKDALGGDFFAFSGGNYVVIKHSGGEFSSYAHLREGGVLVEAGESVHRGQHIGYVGKTGETSLVHLHFQVTDRPPDFEARSLPFKFTGVREQPFEPGYIVHVNEEQER